jgi:hypothetical protein
MKFRIILEAPPAGIDFGLQSGKGNDYKTLQIQRSKSGDLHFEFELEALRGPLVQGSGNERFVYIDIGTYAGQTNTLCARRLKVQVKSELFDGKTKRWTVRIPGTGKDGGPTCASVKPFPGWKPE